MPLLSVQPVAGLVTESVFAPAATTIPSPVLVFVPTMTTQVAEPAASASEPRKYGAPVCGMGATAIAVAAAAWAETLGMAG